MQKLNITSIFSKTIVCLLLFVFIGCTTSEPKKDVTIIDFSQMMSTEAPTWCTENNIKCTIKEEYSDTVASKSLISQSVGSDEIRKEGSKITIIYSLGKEPSKEYKNALKKAESYSDNLHMSKKAIYDQLVSPYGENFPADAAQYAIDNMEADWNYNALKKAESYRDNLNMSKNSVYEQLISKYGEQFTKAEAQYAVDNMD